MIGLILNFFILFYFIFWDFFSFFFILNIGRLFYFYDFFFNLPVFVLFGFLFLLSSVFSLILFNYLGFYGIFVINFISIFCFWFSFLFYVNGFFLKNYYCYLSFGKWITLGSNLRINFDLFFDVVSISFAFLTITIGLCVYIYSFSYFRYEPNVERLVVFLNLFMISMIFLVTSANFVCLFLGWELIGITSFLLINFWACRINTLKSAFKAYSFNKASDAFLLFAILLIFNKFFTLDINIFLSQLFLYSNVFVNFLSFKVLYLDLISFFFLACAFIKSAQFGPHIWLPDSMEAPVPASALIHSATLVSAGVFLVLRFFSLFEVSYYSFFIVSFFGALTAFLGGFISMHQSDTKKVLAYSTISHCGFLMVVASTGVLEYCILYLYIHGFFKAAVFMCFGTVNRFNRNIQDFKKMGYFFKYIPFEAFLSFVGLLNLSGLPFSLGFYIKHLLFVALDSSSFLFYFILVNCFFAALTGLFYSSRLYFSVFFDFKKARLTFLSSSISPALCSKFYSNSSLSSNFAISLIFFLAYFFCSYLLLVFNSDFFVFNDFFFSQLTNSLFANFLASFDFLNNFAYTNIFTLFFIFIILFSRWRLSFVTNFFSPYFFLFFFFFTLSFFFV